MKRPHYVLLLPVPSKDGETYKIINSPGIITISEDRPDADVGEVRLESL